MYNEKLQLESTVKDLTKEVEELSSTNDKLLSDLKHRTFFDQYQTTLTELNKLKEEQEIILDYKIKNIEEFVPQQRKQISQSLCQNSYKEFLDNVPLVEKPKESNNIEYLNNGSGQLTSTTCKINPIKVPKKDSIKRKKPK